MTPAKEEIEAVLAGRRRCGAQRDAICALALEALSSREAGWQPIDGREGNDAKQD